jgi:hypothetical protein
MGQVFKKYWTSVSKKPKGFKFLGSNIYEYEVSFVVNVDGGSLDSNVKCYKELIPTHYKYVGEHGEREINQEKFKQSVYILTGIRVSNLPVQMFKRDGILVPFVEYIDVPLDQTEQYLQYRKLRDRIVKINKLKDKI